MKLSVSKLQRDAIGEHRNDVSGLVVISGHSFDVVDARGASFYWVAQRLTAGLVVYLGAPPLYLQAN